MAQKTESKTHSVAIIGLCIALAGLMIAFAVYMGDKNEFPQFVQQPLSTIVGPKVTP